MFLLSREVSGQLPYDEDLVSQGAVAGPCEQQPGGLGAKGSWLYGQGLNEAC